MADPKVKKVTSRKKTASEKKSCGCGCVQDKPKK